MTVSSCCVGNGALPRTLCGENKVPPRTLHHTRLSKAEEKKVWGYTPAIPVLGGWREGDLEVEASLIQRKRGGGPVPYRQSWAPSPPPSWQVLVYKSLRAEIKVCWRTTQKDEKRKLVTKSGYTDKCRLPQHGNRTAKQAFILT